MLVLNKEIPCDESAVILIRDCARARATAYTTHQVRFTEPTAPHLQPYASRSDSCVMCRK